MSWRRSSDFKIGLLSPDTNSKNFCEMYGFKNTELEDAIIRNREVYINGKYIAVKTKWSKCSDLLDELNLSYYGLTI